MIKKGIILAGGRGTRLSPATKSTNKQLLPLYDKPLFFYPLSVLMLAGIRKILIITNPKQDTNFKNSIGNGSHLGIEIKYIEQKKPSGIPEAFKLGKKFILNDNVALILGDNFFYGQSLTKLLEFSKNFKKGCTIFLKTVNKPENYGVAQIKNNQIKKILEKPKNKISNEAITGLYFFDNQVSKLCLKLKPSKRGETEIVDLINLYKNKKLLNYLKIGRGAIWSDVGKIDDYTNISNYIASVEKVQNIKIACLEEISLKNKWIDKKQIKKNIQFYGNCPYSEYLSRIINEKN